MMEIMISLTPTGARRNDLCHANILLADVILYCHKSERVEESPTAGTQL